MRLRASPATLPVRPPFRRKYLVEALEPRVLLSADLPVVPPPVSDPLPAMPPADAVAASAGGEASAAFQFDGASMAEQFVAPAMASDAPAPEAAPAPTEIAFVDGRVVGQDGLSLQRDGMLVVVLDANQDGIAQISEVLARHQDVRAVHILAHGEAGEMFLGNGILDAKAVTDGKVADWGRALSSNGDVLLYGCNVAEGESGQSFVQLLARATGADVGASTDATGSAARGGDGILEYTLGALETAPLSVLALDSLLAVVNGTGGNDTLAFGTAFTWGDVVDGKAGTDVLNFASASTDLTFTITGVNSVTITDATHIGANSITAVNIEGLTGGSGADTFVFNAGGSVAGTLTGGSGNDTIDYSAFSTAVSVNLGAGTSTNTGGISGIENATGGSAGDTLVGSTGANVLTGGAGNDTLGGGGGADTISGGADSDTLDYGTSAALLTFTITGTAGSVSVTGGTSATGIENLVGGTNDDSFVFADAATIAGTISGGGGAANKLDYSAYTTAVTVNLATGTATGVGGEAAAKVSNIQNVTGGSGDDDIAGDGNDNTLVGGGGADTYRFADGWGNDTVTETLGGGGGDTLDFSAVTSAVSLAINFAGTIGSVTVGDDPLAPGNAVSANYIENVTGGAGNDTFAFASGFALVGNLDGGAGNDLLDYSRFGGNLDEADIDLAGGVVPSIVGAADNFESIQHPTDAVQGLQSMFGALRDVVGNTIGQVKLPLVGDAISVGITDFVDVLELALLGDGNPGGNDGLIEALNTSDDTLSTDQIIRHALSHLELSSNIGTADMPATLTVVFDFTGGVLEARLVIVGTIFHAETDIDFASALPGLGLSIESTGGLQVDLGYVLNLGIGLDFNSGGGFYIDTNGPDNSDPGDDEEFTLTLQAAVTDGTEIGATLGFLGMKLTDQTSTTGTAANPDDGRASGLYGTFAIDLLDPGTGAAADGHLKLSELKAAAPKDIIEVHLRAEADADLIGVLDMGTAVLPSISTILHYNQSFADVKLAFGGGSTATFGGAPNILFEDVTLDLGSFFGGFLEPIITKIKIATEPLQPVIDVLEAPLPIFSDLPFLSSQFNYDNDPDGNVTLLDLAGTLLGQTKYGPVITAINAVADIISFVNNIPTDEADGLKINFGDYAFNGTDIRVGDALKHSNAPATTNEDPGAQLDSADSQIGADPNATPGKKGALAKLRSGLSGFDVPLLTSPATVFSLLMGKDVPLFTYNLPDLTFNFGLNIRVPLFGPLFMKLSGDVTAEIKAGFGFDTAGIRAYLTSHDVGDIFLKGFYLDDHWVGGADEPEVKITSTLAAYAALGIGGLVEAGVGGGVTATIEFDLNDLSTSTDGKIFLNEFALIAGTSPLCIFDVHGKLEAFLETYVWVGLDLGLLGTITIFYDSWDLARVTIAEFVHHCDIADLPHLAHMNGNELVLNMGVDAGLRDGSAGTDWHTGYEDEAYAVTRGMYDDDSDASTPVRDRIAVSWNGFTEYYDPAAVHKITARDAGAGADVITVAGGTAPGTQIASELNINGGAGDDVIRITGATGLVYLQGGAGNDKITGNSSKTTNTGTHSVTGLTRDRYEGGTGDDLISGSGTSDEIYGGSAGSAANSGNDTIKGNAGDDLIYGGDESGSAGQKANGDNIDGGTGNDTIYAGAGADVIKGGIGNDIIDGGAGADSITGNTGVDTLTGGSGADTFFWTKGDGADVMNGGTDGGTEPTDAFIGTGGNTGDAITLAKSGADAVLSWDSTGAGSPTTFALTGIEKVQLNAGTGADVFTVNDLAGTSIKEIGMSLGATVVDNQVADASAAGFHLVTVTTLDTSVDSVTINSGAGADQFTGQTTTDATSGLSVVNLSRTGTAAISYSISQTDAARDAFTLQSFAGNDSVDLSAVRTASFASTTIDAGGDNNTVFGTQFADTIITGAGNDRIAGNGGLDTFTDGGGYDVLTEANDGSATFDSTSSGTTRTYFDLTSANFTLDGNSLTIVRGSTTELESIAPFEEVAFVAGSGDNTFNVQNWAKIARLDGGAGSDTYSIHFLGSGNGAITENDSIHVAGNVDRMFLYGTSAGDQFGFTADNTTLPLTDGTVTVTHGTLVSPTVESVHYTHSEQLEVRGGNGNDIFTVDDNALTLRVYGEAGNDNFIIGRVTSSHIDPGTGALVADAVTNGISSESFFYGDFGEDAGGNEINVAQSGNDEFEVNHNLAPLWLFGNAGDDRFVVNAVLVQDVSGTATNPNNVSGGSGSNTITYLQNAPVNIDGGSGHDVVVVNGTGISDTFIVAVVMVDDNPDPAVTHLVPQQKVIGAGLQINMKNVERLEVNGAGGDDFIHVYSTLPDLEVVVSGGSGNDTIHIGGEQVAIVVDPPAYTIDPPAYTYDPPAYIDHWDSQSWSWGGYWYFDWTWPLWHYQPVVTYTWWYPVWVDPAPVVIDPPPQTIDPAPFQFAAAQTNLVTGIQGKLTIDAGAVDSSGGTNDNDRIVVHNTAGDPANTFTLTSGDHDGLANSPDVGYASGLGMTQKDGTGATVTGGFYYLNAENLDIYLSDNATTGDDVTLAYTDPDTTTTIFGGQGNDHFRVKAANGVVQLDGGAGSDSFDVWNDLNLVSDIAGTLRINGGAGTDSVDVRDTADTTGDTGTLSASSLTGLDMPGSIQYGSFADQTFSYSYLFQTVNGAPPPTVLTTHNTQSFTFSYAPIESLTISLGSGDDVLDVTGTQAITTINANNGNDTVNVSSDGAALQGSLDAVSGALALHLGAGSNTLNVSDFGDPDADTAVTITSSAISGLAPSQIAYDTSGRFTGGVNIWAGRGNDVIGITSTLIADVTTLYTNDGDDAVTVANLTGGSNRLLAIHGDAGNDMLDVSATTGSNVTVVLFGDSGQESYLGPDKTLLNLTGVASIAIGSSGNDTLVAGAGPAILVGGGNNAASAVNSGRDRLTGAGFNDVLIGDDGAATFNAAVVTAFGSLGTAGGDDQIDAGDGRNYVIGGVGGDVITAGAGNDVILGDNGSVSYTAGGVIVSVQSSDLSSGSSDTITAGEGSNVVVGGAAGDTIGAAGAGAGDDVLLGDNGSVTWDPATGFVSQFSSLGADGGKDTIVAGNGRNLVLGGVGADAVTAGSGDDVVVGDNGTVRFSSLGVIIDATTTDLGQGSGDSLDAGAGNNVVLGGAGGDTITTLGGVDVVIGDGGAATWTAGVLTQIRSTDATASTGGDDVIDAGSGRNYVVGGVGADEITAGADDDVVLGDNGIVHFTTTGVITDATATELGLGGGDTVVAGDGNNVVLGGAGGDTITALGGTDVVIGDNGQASWTGGVLTQFKSSDTTAGTGGDDTINTGDGRNYLIGGVGADGITSGTGDDVVLGDNGIVNFTMAGVITDATATELGLGGSDTVDAGGGNNVVIGGAAGDTLTSGAGNDIVVGDNGKLAFTGGVLTEAVTTDVSDATGGNDTIVAGDGNNVVLGGVGNDTITTGSGNDVIVGDNGIAQFNGMGALLLVEARDPALIGNDTIDAGAGNDVVIGGAGADSILGGAGNDVLIGDGGTATFSAGSLTQVVGDSTSGAADFISGGAGNDILLGGFGDDSLSANLTDDLFTGGNARISFSDGLVTSIELIDGADLVLQTLFDSFGTTDGNGTIVFQEGNAKEGGEGAAGGVGSLLDSFGTEGIFASDGTLVLPGQNALSFSFGRGVPLSQIPELLRNIVLELSLGAGNAPSTHGGESGAPGTGDEGQGRGDTPAAGGEVLVGDSLTLAPEQAPFAVETEATTMRVAQPVVETAQEQPALALGVGAAVLTGLHSASAARVVQTFDPANGRLAERRASVPSAGDAILERAAFAARSIDW